VVAIKDDCFVPEKYKERASDYFENKLEIDGLAVGDLSWEKVP